MTSLLRLPMPTPDRVMWQHGTEIQHFTAQQMRDYGAASAALWEADALRARAMLADDRTRCIEIVERELDSNGHAQAIVLAIRGA